MESSQLLGGELLLVVSRTAVEDPHQGLLVEVRDLISQGLYVVNFVAIRQTKVGNSGAGRSIIIR
jgi:phage protein U